MFYNYVNSNIAFFLPGTPPVNEDQRRDRLHLCCPFLVLREVDPPVNMDPAS